LFPAVMESGDFAPSGAVAKMLVLWIVGTGVLLISS